MLPFFPQFFDAKTKDDSIMRLYRDVMDVPDSMDVYGSPSTLAHRIVQRLGFDMHGVIMRLELGTMLQTTSVQEVEAYLFTLLRLEDLFQAEEVHPDYIPEAPNDDISDLLFSEFNLPDVPES